MGHLVRGSDAGGVRYFLDDRPVYAGTALELRLPGNQSAADAACAGSGRRNPGDRCERCHGRGELQGIVLGEPDKAVPCDVAHHGTASARAECEGGRVAEERACSDCEGRGKRWMQVERPYGGRGVVRGDRFDVNLCRAELRWPARPR